MNPKVSVVMPVYNEEEYISDAIESVLSQSFKDFEFVIVNDGSDDRTGEIIDEYAELDNRIKKIDKKNGGIAESINEGLENSLGKYIARMDGDDITHHERFEHQVDFLDKNGHIGILGTRNIFIDADGNSQGRWNIPTNPDTIGWKLLFNSCLVHPSVMMRRSLIEDLEGYETWASPAEDYELWTRAVQKTQIANLPDAFHKIRRHSGSATVSRREEQLQVVADAGSELHHSFLDSSWDDSLSRFLIWMEVKEIDRAVEETGVEDLSSVHEYLRKLYQAYRRHDISKPVGIDARRAALPKLDRMAGNIGERGSRAAEAFYKISSRLMPPVSEIPPWIMKSVSGKLKSIPTRIKNTVEVKNRITIKQGEDSKRYKYTLEGYKRKKAIFVHIPRAAGNSISQSIFGNCGGGHKSIKEYKEIFGIWYSLYYKFTFVRNPFSRLVSAYDYLKKGGHPAWPSNRQFGEEVIKSYDGFSDFVLSWLRVDRTSWPMPHFRPQVYFLCIEERMDVDFIGAVESIEDDFKEVARHLGVDADLEKRNEAPGKRKPTEAFYTDDRVVQRVREVYSSDFEQLGYSLDVADADKPPEI